MVVVVVFISIFPRRCGRPRCGPALLVVLVVRVDKIAVVCVVCIVCGGCLWFC